MVKLRARTKDDGTVRYLRWLLKRLLRDHQLVCVSVSEERGACSVNTPAPSHLVMKRRAKFIRTVGIWVFALVASAVIGFAIGAYFQRPDGPSGGALWGMIAALGIFISARLSLSSATR